MPITTRQREKVNDEIRAARSSLARKVLEAVEAEEESRFGKGAHGISGVLRELFQTEGIALLPQREEQGGEGRST